MSDTATLPPQAELASARQLAAASTSRWAGESAGYRAARTGLLAEALADGSVVLAGDKALAERFVALFALPEKVA